MRRVNTHEAPGDAPGTRGIASSIDGPSHPGIYSMRKTS